MRTVIWLTFFMFCLVIVGSFIGQGYGMVMCRYMPHSEVRLNPVVKHSLEFYQNVLSWFGG